MAGQPTDLAALADLCAARAAGGADRMILAIAGPPGSGKSTLAEGLAAKLNAQTPGLAEVLPMAKGIELTASQLLERFLFPPASQYSFVSTLSGGEKRRCA